MRVLSTVDSVGGVWRYGLDLARALGDRGVETVLVHLGPAASEAQRAEARVIPGATLIETGLPLDWLCDEASPVFDAGRAIAAMAEDLRADILQLNMPALGAAARPAMPTVAVAHGCVATWWEAAYPGEPLDPAFGWHRRLVADGLRAADRTVAPTAAYARTVARHYGLKRTPLIVHNGRTPLAALPPAAMHDCVLTVGRLWDRVKQTELLDRVAARLAVPFHAAGPIEGPHGERASVRHLHLLGEIGSDTLARQLSARPVFVSAASFEPFGLAVLEAAMAGCALVLSDIPGFRELWEGAACFVPLDDERGFAEAIEALIGDSERRLKLGDAAGGRAARYSIDAMADGMTTIYADALERALPGRRAAA